MDFHRIGTLCTLISYPVVDLLVSKHPAQSASTVDVRELSSILSLLRYVMPKCVVPCKYRRALFANRKCLVHVSSTCGARIPKGKARSGRVDVERYRRPPIIER